MKVTAVLVFKWNGAAAEPTLLGSASELSSFGFFQRGTVQEMLIFVSRTVGKKTQPGQRQTVENEDTGLLCHAHNRDGLAATVFVDQEYPTRSAFCIVNKVLDDFVKANGEAWRAAQTDSEMGNAVCEAAVANYQDPSQADKLLKIQQELDETKVVLHKTMDSMLERGEKLDNLVAKSSDLSMASQMFYRQARKQNQCCKMM